MKKKQSKCDCCGKFRKASELISFSESDGDGWENNSWYECRSCMSPADEERYFGSKESYREGL
jgi:hypothetical protein